MDVKFGVQNMFSMLYSVVSPHISTHAWNLCLTFWKQNWDYLEIPLMPLCIDFAISKRALLPSFNN